MVKRLLPTVGLLGVFAVAVFGLSAAADSSVSFDRTEAFASFQSGQTSTFINVSRGTSVFESDDTERLQSGTFVNVNIFTPGPPGSPPTFEFGCFKIPDSAFTGGLAGAALQVTIGGTGTFGDCGGKLVGGPDGPAIAGGGGPIIQPLPLRKLTIDLAWNPTSAVSHDTFSSTHSCLDFTSSSQSSRDSVRASATGTINGATVKSSAGFGPGAQIAVAQGEFSSEGTPSPSCGFFRG